jgi:predicted nuclease with RNAse H fold
VLELNRKSTIGIDLAGKPENPSGYAVLEGKKIETSLQYTDKQILRNIVQNRPVLIAIDAPFNLPKKGILRKADEEMIKNGYRVFPPNFPAMKTLTLRAIELNKLIAERGFKTLEVHPTSTRKALSIPLKDWRKIQTVLTQIGLEGALGERTLAPHEIDAVVAAFTAHLYIKGETEAIGDEEEGYIIVPKRQDWRRLQI